MLQFPPSRRSAYTFTIWGFVGAGILFGVAGHTIYVEGSMWYYRTEAFVPLPWRIEHWIILLLVSVGLYWLGSGALWKLYIVGRADGHVGLLGDLFGNGESSEKNSGGEKRPGRARPARTHKPLRATMNMRQ